MQILGKLIYYNKVFRIETICPVSTGKIHQSYFENQLKITKSEYKESISNEGFLQILPMQEEQTVTTVISGSAKSNYHDGLKSAVFRN